MKIGILLSQSVISRTFVLEIKKQTIRERDRKHLWLRFSTRS